jgi:hypothetical protein
VKRRLTAIVLLCLLFLTAQGCEKSTAEETTGPFSFEGHWVCTYVEAMGLTMKSGKVDMEYTLDIYADGMGNFNMGTSETLCTWEETEDGYTISCFGKEFPVTVEGQDIVWNFNSYYMTFEKEGDAVLPQGTDPEGTRGNNGPLFDEADPETPAAGSVPATIEVYEELSALGLQKYALTYGEVCAYIGCHGVYVPEASEEDSAVYRWADETGLSGITITFRDTEGEGYQLYSLSHNIGEMDD